MYSWHVVVTTRGVWRTGVAAGGLTDGKNCSDSLRTEVPKGILETVFAPAEACGVHLFVQCLTPALELVENSGLEGQTLAESHLACGLLSD